MFKKILLDGSDVWMLTFSMGIAVERDGKILGNRCGDRVLCPPLEYDPDTGATLEPDFVEVGPGGTVQSWTWVAEPTSKHPFDHPFAFALILLDGASTPMVHAIDAGSIDRMQTGMRVQAQFRDERIPKFLDHFEAATRAVAGEWVAGGRWSYVDNSLFQVIAGLRYAFPRRMATLAPHYPGLVALHDRVAALPGVTAYLASERRLPFSEEGIFRHYPELDGH